MKVVEFQPISSPQISPELHVAEPEHRSVTRTTEHAPLGGSCTMSKGIYTDAHMQIGSRSKRLTRPVSRDELLLHACA